MKSNVLKISIILAAIAFTAHGCKYEEGPFISVRSKSERIANTWVIENAYENGKDVTSDYDQYDLFLSKDGKARLTSNHKSGGVTFSFSTDGVWVFENNKNDIRFDFGDDDADGVYEILRLKETELWIKEKGGVEELHLKTK